MDLGTAFFELTGNAIPVSKNIAIYSTANVHDGTISDNTIGYVDGPQNAVGLYLEGSPNVKVTGNSFAGGNGDSIGILVKPQTTGIFSWPDTGDVLSGNTVQGFTTAQEVE